MFSSADGKREWEQQQVSLILSWKGSDVSITPVEVHHRVLTPSVCRAASNRPVIWSSSEEVMYLNPFLETFRPM